MKVTRIPEGFGRNPVALTRQDFQFIADTIGTLYPELMPNGFKRIVEHFADALAQTNPRFNRDRFVMACYKARGGQ